MKIDGNVIGKGSVDINGGILTINGDLLHQSGEIYINSGTLNINGNYTMENTTENNIGKIVYNDCCTQLSMKNEYDKVNIGGNFTTHKLYYSYNSSIYLGKGTLSVGGDIWSDMGISTSNSYGYKTILNGDGKQSVTLNESNKFNILELTKDKSNYTFNPDPYWNELIEKSPVVTTAPVVTTTVNTTTGSAV